MAASKWCVVRVERPRTSLSSRVANNRQNIAAYFGQGGRALHRGATFPRLNTRRHSPKIRVVRPRGFDAPTFGTLSPGGPPKAGAK